MNKEKQNHNIVMIEAGGGLVINDFGEYLLIFRSGKWDLPKGKKEEGETPPLTALREVQEECGLNTLTLGRFIACTRHSYWVGSDIYFKRTFWYQMCTKGKPNPCPQTEEGIEQCNWCSLEEAKQLLNESYPSIRWLFYRATTRIRK